MPMFSMGGCTTIWSQGKLDGSGRFQVCNHSDTVGYHTYVQHGSLYHYMVTGEARWLWPLSLTFVIQ